MQPKKDNSVYVESILLSLQGFCRRWNASLHIWLAAYIYSPLGGRARMLRNTLAVFSFVALLLGIEVTNFACASGAALLYCSQEVMTVPPTSLDHP